jgi:single-strand DNA-binding protein
MALNQITIDGNLTADTELRFTPSGAAVCNGTIAHTPRRMNRQTNEWEDGETVFLRWSVWRDQAENAAESLQRGDRVVAVGKLAARSWETKEGEKRTVLELEADTIAPSLQRATAKVQRTQRSGSQQAAPQGDPWATGSGSGPSWGNGSGNGEPAF